VQSKERLDYGGVRCKEVDSTVKSSSTLSLASSMNRSHKIVFSALKSLAADFVSSLSIAPADVTFGRSLIAFSLTYLFSCLLLMH